jgi:uncharacterized protein YigE (DUF2233 family)
MIRAVLLGLGVLALAGSGHAACERVRFDGAAFTACRIDMERDDVRLFLSER